MIDEKTNILIRPGAKVRVHSVGDGSASGGEAPSVFEGLVLARKHGNEPGATFTVRTVVKGVGVEKVYPIHSPAIEKVVIIGGAKRIRRSKLYFVRESSGSRIRKKLGVSL